MSRHISCLIHRFTPNFSPVMCSRRQDSLYHEAFRIDFIRPDLGVLISWVWSYSYSFNSGAGSPSTDPSGLYANASLTSCIMDSKPHSISSPDFACCIHFYFDVLFEVHYYHTLKRQMKPSPFFYDTQSPSHPVFHLWYTLVIYPSVQNKYVA